jgi:hypothetical protein
MLPAVVRSASGYTKLNNHGKLWTSLVGGKTIDMSDDSPAMRLDRLDQQVDELRRIVLEIAVATTVTTPELRGPSFSACVDAGLLTSSQHTFLRDVRQVVAAVKKAGSA